MKFIGIKPMLKEMPLITIIMTTDKLKLVNRAIKKFLGATHFTLNEESENELKNYMMEVMAPYYIYDRPPNGKKKKRRGKKKEGLSAYNVFVKEKMQSPEIKALGDNKARLKEVGAKWKKVKEDPEALERYKTLALAGNKIECASTVN
jgi:hypothetical protein